MSDAFDKATDDLENALKSDHEKNIEAWKATMADRLHRVADALIDAYAAFKGWEAK